MVSTGLGLGAGKHPVPKAVQKIKFNKEDFGLRGTA